MFLFYVYLLCSIFCLVYIIFMNKFNQGKRDVKLVRKLCLSFGIASLLSSIGIYYSLHSIELIGRICLFIVLFIISKNGKNLAFC